MTFPLPDDRRPERERMVADQMAARGIRDEHVLAALRRIPREHFVASELGSQAYDDSALPSSSGQTISQPYMVARMTELLEIGPRERVLEIGTGTGYQTAILACLAQQVFTVEWHLGLFSEAARRVRELGLENVTYRCGDGSLGWPENAPYDAIMVTAGAPQLPPALLEQLAEGGRLVVPIGPQTEQTLVRMRKMPSGITREEVLSCRFVRLVGVSGWRE